jgi:hypothetical protein
VANDLEILRQTLRRMPVPEPRPGFADQALARASALPRPRLGGARANAWSGIRQFALRWESWAGAALGAGAAAALTLLLLRPVEAPAPQPLQIALTLNEARQIDVLIDSERELKDATIRIAASGSVALDGFADERQIDWRADLERGSNLLSLPVVARAAGKGQLVALIEHEGRTRRVTIDLTVFDRGKVRSS